ncbi:MAG: hypothetical protein PHV49_05040, partial [Alistipes sp.]|nr:hypothetical protein [Alistipes sp.]
MKRNLLLCGIVSVGLLSSCIKEPDNAVKPSDSGTNNVAHFLTTEEYSVPIRAGYVTIVKVGEDTVATASTPVTILLPTGTQQSKASDVELSYVPVEEFGNNIESAGNSYKLYQVVCFEDSKEGDYDYNDFVFHVKYQRKGNIYGFGIQPIALGSTKAFELGCVVYKGQTQLFKGVITENGNSCRTQYFKDQQGFINTSGNKTINQVIDGKVTCWHQYLGSTAHCWDVSKCADQGAFRVEWYLKLTDGSELYALSTQYVDQSFDKDHLPYGLVISETGYSYTEGNKVCGKDWFNYPLESVHSQNVYPELWD